MGVLRGFMRLVRVRERFTRMLGRHSVVLSMVLGRRTMRFGRVFMMCRGFSVGLFWHSGNFLRFEFR